jgi:hypothetical protein
MDVSTWRRFSKPLICEQKLRLNITYLPTRSTPSQIRDKLQAIAEGQGTQISANVSLMWVEDAKGKPALRLQPTKQC